jgi:hypothetical protein
MSIAKQVGMGLVDPAAQRFRPTMDPRKAVPAMAALVERCWATRPEERPTFAEVRAAPR